jgi:predicted nucleotidyltransferase/HEPN domain-containing protein
MRKALVPRALLDPVVRYFNPQRVILFGSRARGEAGRDSDIDLLVVVDDDTPPEKLTWEAGATACRPYRRAADVFPMRADTFEQERNIVGHGGRSRRRRHRHLWRGERKSVDESRSARALEGGRELARGGRPRPQAAAVCLAADPPLRGIAAFHCQQAIEKLLKGFLVLAAKRSRKTHSLEELGAAAQARFPEIAASVAAAKDWSRWAVDFRYPGNDGRIKPAPDENQLRRALEVIDALAAHLRAANPEPG